MLIFLDVDGVLAKEDQENQDPHFLEPQQKWANREPLWVGSAEEIAKLLWSLQGHEVQIVTRRPPHFLDMTLIWLQQHYPWLAKFIKGVSCIGPTREKLSVGRPDVAIDDSTHQIGLYVEVKVPVVAVESYLTNVEKCATWRVPVMFNVRAALTLASALYIAGVSWTEQREINSPSEQTRLT